MYQTEVGADAIKTWADATLLQNQIDTDWNLLKQAQTTAPLAVDCFKVAAYMMAVDLHRAMVEEIAPPSQILANVSGFYKFCGAELHMPKKDLPKSLTDRIDKCAKAARVH